MKKILKLIGLGFIAALIARETGILADIRTELSRLRNKF